MSVLSMIVADYHSKIDQWKAYELDGYLLFDRANISAQVKAEKLAVHLMLMGLGLNRIGENLLRGGNGE